KPHRFNCRISSFGICWRRWPRENASFLQADRPRPAKQCLDQWSRLGSDRAMWIRAALTVVLLVAAPDFGRAAGPDDSLLAYSVGVNGGAGIYLGQGLVLSVAHVVGGGIVNKPSVTIAGQTLTAHVCEK